MNLDLKCNGFEEFIIRKEPQMGGVAYKFRFGNRYGASVIKHSGSYGHEEDLWELAVIHFGCSNDNWNLCYSTPITQDVEGYLTDNEVCELSQRIKDL